MSLIDSRNKLYEKKFKDISNKDIGIFLPHCLRNENCPAKTGKEGIECIDCGLCGIGKFKKDAENAEYHVYIVPGGSMVKRILKENDFKAVLGVACIPELKQAIEMLKDDKKLISLAVPLSKDGCANTEVSWEKVRKVCGL